MKYIGILLGLLLWPAACMAPPTYGPYPTGGGGLSSNEVYAIALSVGGPTNGISAAAATNIVNNNNAATATTATTATTASAISSSTNFQSVLDVTKAPFNVVADGVTDNTTGLQLALDTLGYSNTYPTRILQLPLGVIVVNSSLTLPRSGNRETLLESAFSGTNGYTIRGHGRNNTWLDGRAMTSGAMLSFVSPYYTNKLTGLRLTDFAMIGPNMTKTGNLFEPDVIRTNNATAGIVFHGPATSQHVAREITIQDLQVWGFGTNLLISGSTEILVTQTRFFMGSVYDYFGIKNDNLTFHNCSFGWQGYASNNTWATNAGFIASISENGYGGGADQSGNYSGRGTAFPGSEVYYSPRLGMFDDAVVSFPYGFNAENNSYPGASEMFVLTNANWFYFGNGSINNWNQGTTNQSIFRCYNGGSKRLVLDNVFMNVSSGNGGDVRLFSIYDGANVSKMYWPKVGSSGPWSTTIPQIQYNTTNFYELQDSSAQWNEDLRIAQPDWSDAGWIIPTPAESPTLFMRPAIWTYPKVANYGTAYFNAPSRKGFNRAKVTISLQGDTGVSGQAVEVYLSALRFNSVGTTFNDYPYSIWVSNIAAGVTVSGSSIIAWNNDTDLRSVMVKFNDANAITNKVWVTRVSCQSLP